MNKYILITVAALSLVGCTKPPSRWTVLDDSSPQNLTIPGLTDCVAYTIATGGNTMKVIRCPNSHVSISQPQGKVTLDVTVIDDNSQSDSGTPVDNTNHKIEAESPKFGDCMDVGDPLYVMCSKHKLRGQ